MKNKTIAVDLAKSVFEVGVSERAGHVKACHRLSRKQFREFFVKQEPAKVVMEACGSAHYYYCVTNEAIHRTDNEEAAESGSGRCECEAWQSSRGYVVRAGSGVPRGLKCLGSLGTDSPTCSTNAEGEKRLRSATRNP